MIFGAKRLVRSQEHGAFHLSALQPVRRATTTSTAGRRTFEHAFVGETAGAAGNGCIGCLGGLARTWRWINPRSL